MIPAFPQPLIWRRLLLEFSLVHPLGLEDHQIHEKDFESFSVQFSDWSQTAQSARTFLQSQAGSNSCHSWKNYLALQQVASRDSVHHRLNWRANIVLAGCPQTATIRYLRTGHPDRSTQSRGRLGSGTSGITSVDLIHQHLHVKEVVPSREGRKTTQESRLCHVVAPTRCGVVQGDRRRLCGLLGPHGLSIAIAIAVTVYGCTTFQV